MRKIFFLNHLKRSLIDTIDSNLPASYIGLECESGEFHDCFQKRYFNESLPTGCEEVLIFSQSNETCGKSCGQERKKSSQNAVIKEGWTLYIRFSRPT